VFTSASPKKGGKKLSDSILEELAAIVGAENAFDDPFVLDAYFL